MKQILGLIPARGGSKGVPNKNLRPLAGKPLLAYTIDAARASARLSRVVLSTDDAAIAAAGQALGAEVPFMRPADLAADDTPMLPVLQHAVRTLAGTGFHTDVLVLLQPTSPLRSAEHIDAAVDLLVRTGCDSVVSVVEVPHQFSPVSVMRMAGDRLSPYAPGPLVTRRQDKPRLYARNGPAVLAVRVSVLAGGSLYGEDSRALVMTPEASVDIDGPSDFDYAEYLLARAAVPASVAGDRPRE
jgi:CMP-N-acetylneuraminic acid synthetase